MHIVAIEWNLIENPVKPAPTDSALACSLSCGAEEDVAAAEISNNHFLKFSPGGDTSWWAALIHPDNK